MNAPRKPARGCGDTSGLPGVPEYRLEERIKALIRTKCRGDRAPEACRSVFG